MAYNSELIYLSDPSGEVENSSKGQLSNRLSNIEDACIGLLSNQKPNVDPLLNEIGRILVEEYGVDYIIKKDKPNQSLPAEENIINELSSCNAVVHGVGD